MGVQDQFSDLMKLYIVLLVGIRLTRHARVKTRGRQGNPKSGNTFQKPGYR